MNIFRFALTAILASASVTYVASNPNGAGGCKEGEAAVSGSHLESENLFTGSLERGGFSVTIDDQTPVDNTVTTNSRTIVVQVIANSDGLAFKGILIRVGNATSDQVLPGKDLQVADVCGDVGSATHIDAEFKKVGAAIITLDDDATLNLDITVVEQNNDDVSAYWYSGYKVIAQSDASCRDGLLFRQCGGGK
jgi:hypothetical protein